MRYLVIEYNGRSTFDSKKEIKNYEFSNDLSYLRSKYFLKPIVGEFNFTLQADGFSIYPIKKENGYLLIDQDIISKQNKIGNGYTEKVLITLSQVLRDQKLNNILN